MGETELTFDLPVDPEKVAEFATAVGEDNPLFFDPRGGKSPWVPERPGSTHVHRHADLPSGA